MWFECFVGHVMSLGFVQSKVNTSLFMYNYNDTMVYLLLYVDDMILSASTIHLLWHLIACLQDTFEVKDMGSIRYFLGIAVQRTKDSFFLSESKYAKELLEHAGMANYNVVAMPTDMRPKPFAMKGQLISDTITY